ncbi:hypothetical protein MIND_00862100 [Mycena indigotica]|uniref:Uncharacterized protein n=1 Tax=Mycena indigotica TaxID=2126181 RepID=A0A8H6SGM9_9AGAR|nr:uncharacterized protein MIND_00862100 [Mycena indigotica]KAF7299136.1 hypothetical protein MIND_00862100 [Mycena indigotica]
MLSPIRLAVVASIVSSSYAMPAIIYVPDFGINANVNAQASVTLGPSPSLVDVSPAVSSAAAAIAKAPAAAISQLSSAFSSLFVPSPSIPALPTGSAVATIQSLASGFESAVAQLLALLNSSVTPDTKTQVAIIVQQLSQMISQLSSQASGLSQVDQKTIQDAVNTLWSQVTKQGFPTVYQSSLCSLSGPLLASGTTLGFRNTAVSLGATFGTC